MMRHILAPLAALAVCLSALPARAGSDESSGTASSEAMRNWAADHEAFLDAKLAGLKAGLKLTPDQDKLWPPLETAIRDAAKLRMDQMTAMRDRMRKMREMMQGARDSKDMTEMAAPGQAVSPVDRLEAMGQRMSARGAAITKVADAAKPLYASLDDSQKRRFVVLGRELFMTGHHRHAMEMMRGAMGMMGGMGHEGMEPRDQKSEKTEPAEDHHDEMEKDHDEKDHDSDDD